MNGIRKTRGVRPEPNAFALERETTPVRIAAALRAEIAKGSLPPGTRIHELDFTAAFNVSRHTLREAISLLVAEGLLTRASFKGVEVTQLSEEDVRDIYAARRLIELAAVDALETAPASVMAALLDTVDALTALPAEADSQTMNDADIKVHLALVAVHKSKRMTAAHKALMAESQILLVRAYPPDDVTATIASHAEFGRMLRAGYVRDARAQLERRLREAEQLLLAALGG
ncbi:MAG TPA: GntR family transcriptional regulator [Acidisoma sp.]|jgi:DNA-binding GntR family transcriptional regulator|nr:GntR family transcriptional regulator [Acidisoma sp.]